MQYDTHSMSTSGDTKTQNRFIVEPPPALPCSMGIPQTPNGRISLPISSLNMIQGDEATAPLADKGKMNDSGKNTGHLKTHKVCTPRKTLKAKTTGGTRIHGNAQLPQLENLATPVARKLHRMGNNSLFNFGFKTTNMNKQLPTPTSVDTTRMTLTFGPDKHFLSGTDKKVCNVHTTGSNCDCMNLFSAKLPSELLHLTQTDDTVDTTDNNSHCLEIDASGGNQSVGDFDLDTTLETLKQLDTEMDSGTSRNRPKRVRFDTENHSDPRHDNIHIRPTEPQNKSVKRTRTPENEPLEHTKRFKGTDRTSTDHHDSQPKPPDTTDTKDKNRFRRFKYTPGTRPWHKESEPQTFSFGQVPAKRIGFIDSLTEDQKKRWYKARGLGTNSDRQAYRFSWVDQALGSLTNTHWAFGTTGLPPWAIGDAKMIADIFQVRANAAREVMEIVRENLRRESSLQQAESQKILDDLEAEFDNEQIAASRAAVELHSDRQLKQLSENLSKKREWLLENQPTEVEALTMRPERRTTKKNEIPKELLSEDEEYVDDYAEEDEQPAPKHRARKRRRTSNEGQDTMDTESVSTTPRGGRRRPRRRPSGHAQTRSTESRPTYHTKEETPQYQ